MSIFNRLMQSTAAQQVKLLGGVKAVFESATQTINDVTALVDRDVDYMQENGSILTNIIVISLLKAEVNIVKANDCVICGDDRYTVKQVLKDDGVVIEAFVRG